MLLIKTLVIRYSGENRNLPRYSRPKLSQARYGYNLNLNKYNNKMIKNACPVNRPTTPSRIDSSQSHSLPKTKSPLRTFTHPLIASAMISTFDTNAYKLCPPQSQESPGQSVELWRNKYEYVLRDNDLLRRQITFMNEQISQLSEDKKRLEQQITSCLQGMVKIFAQKMLQAQQKVFLALAPQQFKIEILHRKISSLRETFKKLNQTESHSHNSDFCWLDQLLGARASFDFTDKIKSYEAENKRRDIKQLSGYDWDKYYLPSSDSEHCSFIEKLFGFGTNEAPLRSNQTSSSSLNSN